MHIRYNINCFKTVQSNINLKRKTITHVAADWAHTGGIFHSWFEHFLNQIDLGFSTIGNYMSYFLSKVI